MSFWADDVVAATEWYTEVLDTGPYFSRPGPDGRPAYVEFRVGDFQAELGLIDRRFQPDPAVTDGARHPGGAVLFWHVDDVRVAVDRLIAMGAMEYEAVTDRDSGFVTASVVDPFGNILGLMRNPHYLEIVERIPEFELPEVVPDLQSGTA